MKIQKIVSDYFHFTKRERIAILAFFGLLILTLIYRISLNYHTNPYLRIEFANISPPVDSFERDQIKYLSTRNPNRVNAPIDPNRASFNELTAIGFSKKQAAIIFNYRKKGGTFIHKEDLLKIFGVDSTCYKKVEKWIALPLKLIVIKSNSTQLIIAQRKEQKLIDLNFADSNSLITVHGIGPYLAHQIINYRNRLGGFITVEQLIEIKGMHTENFSLIKSNVQINTPHKRININNTELKNLASHPYSNWQMAKFIINYREQHGQFRQLSDLSTIYGINETLLSKLKPYLYIE
jgi:competence protein ComEA